MKKIQFFLNFANYNRKFIKDFSKKTAPLTNLTNKNKSWTWIKKKQQAFDSIKQACINASVLKIFDSEWSIRMKTNASDLIIKACLNQKYNKRWHFIIYFSKKLLLTEQNYDVHDKKLLAIIIILKKWKMYVKKESKIIIFMNHKNLLSFIKTKKLNQW